MNLAPHLFQHNQTEYALLFKMQYIIQGTDVILLLLRLINYIIYYN